MIMKKHSLPFKITAIVLILILVFVSMYEMNVHTYSSGTRNYDLHWGFLKVIE